MTKRKTSNYIQASIPLSTGIFDRFFIKMNFFYLPTTFMAYQLFQAYEILAFS